LIIQLEKAIYPGNAGRIDGNGGVIDPEPQISQAEGETVTVDEDVSCFVLHSWSFHCPDIFHAPFLLWSERNDQSFVR
jgi:hypothetical protein